MSLLLSMRSFKVARSFSPAVLISEGRPYTIIYKTNKILDTKKQKVTIYPPKQKKAPENRPFLGKGDSHWKPIIFRVQMMFSGWGFVRERIYLCVPCHSSHVFIIQGFPEILGDFPYVSPPFGGPGRVRSL